MPLVDEEPFRDHQTQPARPTSCTQRLAFTDTPPDAGDHQAQPGNIFTPTTLQATVKAGFTAPPQSAETQKPKKHRKRKQSAASKPAPQTRGLEDNVHAYPRVHEAGKAILSEDLHRIAEGRMLALQEVVLYHEVTLLKEKNPSYPAFTVKVPKEMVDFVREDPADVFFIAFEDIFNLFHSRRLD